MRDTIDILKDYIKSCDKAGNRNILATLNQLLKHEFLTEINIHQRLNDGIEELKRDYKAYLIKSERISFSPISHINDIAIAYSKAIMLDLSSMSLGMAIFSLGRNKWGRHLSKKDIARQLSKVTDGYVETIYQWITEKSYPGASKRKVVSQIENCFGLDNEELTEKIQGNFLLKTPLSTPKKITTGHKHLGDELAQQLQEYFDFKTYGRLPDKKAQFVSKRQVNRGLKGSNTWTSDGNGENLSVRTWRYQFRSYFSLLINDGLKSKKEIRFRDLLNYDYLFYYYTKAKRKEIYTAPIALFTLIVAELCDNTYIDTYYPVGKTQKEWWIEREELKKDLKAWVSELKSRKENKDGKRNIRFIIESENPYEKVSLIRRQLEKNIVFRRPGTKPYMTALKIDLLFNLSLFCPLRVKNFGQLQWGGSIFSEDISTIENPCLLWLEDKQFYFILVPKQFLKNRKSKAISPIRQPVPFFLNGKIRTYLHDRAIYLKKIDNPTRLLFFSSINSLTNIYELYTRTIIVQIWPEREGNYGINMHAMRHLAATLYLADNKRDYVGLATLLNDDLKTVIDVYAKRNDVENALEIMNWATNTFFNGDENEAS